MRMLEHRRTAFLIDRGEQVHSLEQARALAAEAADTAARDEEEEETLLDDAEGEAAEADAGEAFDLRKASSSMPPAATTMNTNRKTAESRLQSMGKIRRKAASAGAASGAGAAARRARTARHSTTP